MDDEALDLHDTLRVVASWASPRALGRNYGPAREVIAHVSRAGKCVAGSQGLKEEAQWVVSYLRKMSKTKLRDQYIADIERLNT